VGEIYTGKVTRLTSFGAFVEILPGKDGLVRLGDLAEYRVARPDDVVRVGDEVMVMVIEVDQMGRINLSRRAVLEGTSEPRPAAGRGGPEGDRVPMRGGSGPSGGGSGRRPRGNGPPPPRRQGGGGFRDRRPRERRPWDDRRGPSGPSRPSEPRGPSGPPGPPPPPRPTQGRR